MERAWVCKAPFKNQSWISVFIMNYYTYKILPFINDKPGFSMFDFTYKEEKYEEARKYLDSL
ncbi:hypothetical protein DVR12_26730 [Chitinophaga silvatica]|uniref:Uncharacterized protein n=1 Tax=Chitinophaga silvatica TaxID=2282649 RepID=A0A3E1Y2Q9_9BACT|nr:hypothetical protein DVR12_26720 [Chitinophaga silvatica]RFS18797.1 hypothetical protein DVR12_26730 [Chitinophaga silvatica]